MYYCYLRGKQNELLAIKESAKKIAEANIVPIIEPVKANARDLLSCMAATKDHNINPILIINPQVIDGELTNDQNKLDIVIQKAIDANPEIQLGYILHQGSTTRQLHNALMQYKKMNFALIHFGQHPQLDQLEQLIVDKRERFKANFFIDEAVSTRYIKHFNSTPKILIQDGFNRLNRNADYRQELEEFFSDIHINYVNSGWNGFGDFSVTGDHFAKGGRLPLTVAIHLTYTPVDDNQEIYIRHFLSVDRVHQESLPVLIEEAFSEVVDFLENRQDILMWSTACNEILTKYKNNQSTSLGYLKKLSIMHHFELMHYLLTNR